MENYCLSNTYWLPKMHKAPIKVRFIVASGKSSIKPLVKTITCAYAYAYIRIFYKRFEIYNKNCKFFTGVNSFWVVKNNKPIVDVVNKLSKRKKAKPSFAFNFFYFT